tara:strand:- start:224 stop:412 length:189 start_codon:yes stop_codon:yes gene_type:complete
MEDEVLIKQSIIDDLKREYLDELSINELQERILSLKDEIDRAEKKIEVKKLSKSNAENFFKK